MGTPEETDAGIAGTARNQEDLFAHDHPAAKPITDLAVRVENMRKVRLAAAEKEAALRAKLAVLLRKHRLSRFRGGGWVVVLFEGHGTVSDGVIVERDSAKGDEDGK